MPEYVTLILQLIAALPEDLAAIETFWNEVSGNWSETDNAKIQEALDTAKREADTEQQELDEED